MGYVELSKLFYRSEIEYISEYKRRFNSPDTIKLNFDTGNNRAFFVQNAEVANIVFQILKAYKSVSLISRQLPLKAHDQFSKSCLINEIVLTNKIEGVYSTRREIASILNELNDTVKERKSRKRFWGLVSQYVKLSAKYPVPVKTCEDLRQLYDELVLEEVLEENPSNAPDGRLFRKESTSVYTSTDREIHRGVYPESAIISKLEDALAFLHNEKVELLYRISVFHYLLGYIHPFYDGNGRLGRFIVSSLLAQEFCPLLSYQISSTIIENINTYYGAFKVCNDPHNLGDMTPFLIMMLSMIKSSILELEETLRTRLARLARYEKTIAALPSGEKDRTADTYYVLIQAGLFSEHGISTNEFIQYLRSSYTTAKKELDLLDGHRLLIKNKIGKENFYQLDLERLDNYLN